MTNLSPYPQNVPVAPDNAGDYAQHIGDGLRKGGFGGRPGGDRPRRPKHAGLILLTFVVLLVASVIALPEVCSSPEDEQPSPTPAGQSSVDRPPTTS